MNDNQPTKEDFKKRDLRWQELELELTRIEAIQHRLTEMINPLPISANSALYDQFDALTTQHRKLLTEQREIEEYMIENEAPGWTST